MFGGLGNLGDIAGMIKKAKEMQGNMKKVREELESLEVAGECGLVKVVAKGDLSVKDVVIDPAAIGASKEELEKMTLEAVNNALSGVKAHSQEKMKEVTGGLDIAELLG
jgi:DNA-binding YbaB/EbfC family protein